MMNENAWGSSDGGAEKIHAVGADTFHDDGEGFRQRDAMRLVDAWAKRAGVMEK